MTTARTEAPELTDADVPPDCACGDGDFYNGDRWTLRESLDEPAYRRFLQSDVVAAVPRVGP